MNTRHAQLSSQSKEINNYTDKLVQSICLVVTIKVLIDCFFFFFFPQKQLRF